MWIDVNDRLPKGCKVVIAKDSREFCLSCIFYPDKIKWIADFGQKPSHFWNARTCEPEHYITHWEEKNARD